MTSTHIKLTKAEIQSGYTRQHWAEGLIEQLPADHDGRNSWLTNYGVGENAERLRELRGLRLDPEFAAVSQGSVPLKEPDHDDLNCPTEPGVFCMREECPCMVLGKPQERDT